MGSPWPDLDRPTTPDGTALAAILDALNGIAETLRERLPAPVAGGQPRKVQEPAPASQPPATIPVAEPAPDKPDEDEEPVSEPAPDLPPPPPRAGRGASEQAWRAWAQTAGVTVPEGAARADIISACQRAGVLTEERPHGSDS